MTVYTVYNALLILFLQYTNSVYRNPIHRRVLTDLIKERQNNLGLY
jgi:hypothetical protein